MSPPAGNGGTAAAALHREMAQRGGGLHGTRDQAPSRDRRGRLRVAVVAGEPSGDNLGSHVLRALRERVPDAEFFGIAGPRMQQAGARSLFPMEKLSVMGYAEALRSLPELLSIRRRLRRMLLDDPPDVFIGVDAPDFNLGLERPLRRAGIPTVHVVSPTVWAWRAGRIEGIRRSVSHMLTLFPFEARIYEQAGIPVTCIGHPLASTLPDQPDRVAMREQLMLPRQGPIIAMLPGSRRSELRFLAEPFIQAARLMANELPEVRFLVPLATRETHGLFEQALRRLGARDLPIKLLFAHADKAMAAADVVLVASGTASMEAALIGRPMVVSYRVAPLTYRHVRRRYRLPYVAMPNILAGEFVVPELLQDDATPDNLAQAVLNLLRDGVVRQRMEARFAALRAELRRDTGALAADAILSLVHGRAAA